MALEVPKDLFDRPQFFRVDRHFGEELGNLEIREEVMKMGERLDGGKRRCLL